MKTTTARKTTYSKIIFISLILLSIGIKGNAQCQASFYTAMTIGNPLKAIFTNTSLPDVLGSTTYLWQFGDSATSTLKNPTHTYASSGTYIVSLTMNYTNGSIQCSDNNQYTLVILGGGSTEIKDNNSTAFASLQNYPNPFSNSTTITYITNQDSEIELTVFDLLGKKVSSIEKGLKQSGKHSFVWNAENINKGVYFIQLMANNQKITKKIIITN